MEEIDENELGVGIVDVKNIFIPDDSNGGDFFIEDNEGGEVSAPSLEDKSDPVNKDVVLDENIVDAPAEAKVNTYFKDVIKTLGGLGIISQVSDDDEFADDDGNSVKFSDLPIDDEETFNAYLKSLYEKKSEGESESKMDLDGVSDFTKKIIEIDKAGGDVTSVLQLKAKAINPISDIDLDTVDGQKMMVSHYLSIRYKDMSNDEIEDMVKLYESKGELEAKAIASKESIEKSFNEYMEGEKKRVEEAKAKFNDNFKLYKKSLKESISSKFQLKDEYVKKALDFATTLDNANNPKLVTDKFKEMLNNPETAADLVLFLYNKEEYDKQKTNTAVSQEKKKIFKQISVKNKKPEGSTPGVVGGVQDEDENYRTINEPIIIKGDLT